MAVMRPWPVLRPQPAPFVGPAASVGPVVPRLPQRRTVPQSLAARLPEVLSALHATAAGPGRHMLRLRAGMAELVLLNRLQARTRRELSKDMLEHAARLIEVTANSWLGAGPPTP